MLHVPLKAQRDMLDGSWGCIELSQVLLIDGGSNVVRGKDNSEFVM